MRHTYSKKGKFKYLYYVCLNAIKRGHKSCPTKSVSADKIKDVVLTILRKLSQEPRLKETTWNELALDEKAEVFRGVLREADYSAKDAVLGLVLQAEDDRHEFEIHIKDLKNIKAAKKEEIKNEPKIRQNLALAHQIGELLDTGKINDVKQLTGHLNMSHARIHQLMAMTLLSPSIQEEILLGESACLSAIPEYKLREITGQTDWLTQRNLWDQLLQSADFPIPAAN